MYVRVRAAESGTTEVTLEEPDDCGRLHLVCEIDAARLARALVDANVGSMQDDRTAVINPEAIVRAVGDRVGSDWGDRFSTMLEHAEAKGWVTADGNLRAHVDLAGG